MKMKGLMEAKIKKLSAEKQKEANKLLKEKEEQKQQERVDRRKELELATRIEYRARKINTAVAAAGSSGIITTEKDNNYVRLGGCMDISIKCTKDNVRLVFTNPVCTEETAIETAIDHEDLLIANVTEYILYFFVRGKDDKSLLTEGKFVKEVRCLGPETASKAHKTKKKK